MDIQEISELKKDFFRFDTNGVKAVIDGPIRPEEFIKSSHRIMWLLQESYTNETGIRINTAEDKDEYKSMNDWKDREDCGSGYYTYLPMVSITYQMLQGETSYAKCFCEEGFNAFKDCSAVVNVRKIPNKEVSSSGTYKQWGNRTNVKEFLAKQVEVYKPHVIIGANTIRNDCLCTYGEDGSVDCLGFNFKSDEISCSGGITFYQNDKILLINGKHFSRMKNTDKEIIIQQLIQWRKMNSL